MIFENDNPFAAYELAEHLRGCIVPYLAMTTKGIPNRVCITAGQVAWDECECGQLAISLQNAYDSAAFPTPWDGTTNAGVRTCGPPLFVYEYGISMLRCASETNDQSAPACDMLAADARVTVEDSWAVRTGLHCCMCAGVVRNAQGIKLFERYQIGEQTAIGPEGLCQGTQITVTIGVKNGGYPCNIS